MLRRGILRRQWQRTGGGGQREAEDDNCNAHFDEHAGNCGGVDDGCGPYFKQVHSKCACAVS